MDVKNMGKDDIINELFGGPEKFRKLLRNGFNFSNVLHGYGPKKTAVLIKHFNEYYPQNDIITEIKSEYPDIEVNDKHTEKLQMKSDEIRELVDFVNSINCGPSYKEKVISKIIDLISSTSRDDNEFYKCIYDITKDPLILKDFISITLKKIDEIALINSWWDKEDLYRYYSYCKYFVHKFCEFQGSVYFTKRDLENYVKEEIRNSHSDIMVDFHKISKSIVQLENEGYIFKKCKNGAYYYRDYYDKEKEILRVLEESQTITYENDILDMADLEDESLTEEQLLAINGIRKNRISTLNGAGGTGKTDKVVKKLCEYVNKNSKGTEKSKKIIFAAPTHAAKKNGTDKIKMEDLIEYTVVASLTFNYEAMGYDNISSGFISKGYTNKLKTILTSNDIEYIFIDESSMMSMLDYYIILKTIDEYLEEIPDSELHIVFIGDVNQLEPIGIGNPYKELLNKIPLFKLTENFRAKESPHLVGFLDLILNNTEKYNRWTLDKKTQNEFCKDIHFNFLKTREEYYPILKEKLIKLREKGIQPYNGKNEKNCFQIISPWGSNSRDYQHVITCLVREIYKGDKSDDFYKEGDDVTFSKNAKGLFYNNDMGEILHKNRGGYTIKLTTPIDKSLIKQKREKDIKGETFYKEVDGYKITILSGDTIIIPLIKNNYEGENKFLKSNYCRTVHSVQGLQFSNVLYVVPENTPFLNLNMNYTAYSRSKDKLYLIGNRYSFEGEHARKGSKGINTILKFKHSLIEEIDEKLSNEENTLITQNMNIEKCLNIRKYKKFATWEKDFGIKHEGECYDCKKDITMDNYHVFLKDDNGNHDIDNLKCVCRWCFNKKR